MALGYTWKQLIQRIQIHIVNDYPSSESTMTDNQILLYINEAMSFGIVGQVYGGAKVLGTFEMPESYIVHFQLAALAQDSVTKNWYSTMPQPPLSLPLGYSVNRVYFANSTNGEGVDCLPIKAKRVGYRKNMPMPFGVRYWITNNRIWFAASDGSSLLNEDCYIDMPSTRAVNLTDMIPLPDDATEMIFTKVIARLKDRLQLPQDIVQDDLPAGNKSS
jgi:hypothetical protein